MCTRFLITSFIAVASLSLAAHRVTLTGRVTDSFGKPLNDAKVMICETGLKKLPYRAIKCTGNPRVTETTIDRDTDDYTIVLDRSTGR